MSIANPPKTVPGGQRRDINDTGYEVWAEAHKGFSCTQVYSGVKHEGKLIRCIGIIIVCQMTTTHVSSIFLPEYVFLSFPELKSKAGLLEMFKINTRFLCIILLSVFSCNPRKGMKNSQGLTSQNLRRSWEGLCNSGTWKAFDLHWGNSWGVWKTPFLLFNMDSFSKSSWQSITRILLTSLEFSWLKTKVKRDGIL